MAVTGAFVSILRSTSFLMTQFDFVFILPLGSAAVSYARKEGIEVHELPLKELRRSIASFLLYFPFLLSNSIKLSGLVKSLNIDLINVNDFYNLLPACYKLFGGKVPYVCYVRFLPSKFPPVLVKVWCYFHRKYAVSIIAVSEMVKQELPYKEKVTVIGNELPAEELEYTSTRSTILLYPANYIQGKGQEFALETFADIHIKFPDWKLRFVGGDMGLKKNREYKNELMKKADGLGLQSQIEWLEFSDNLSTHYTDAGIVLNFSESESFSMTCLEAMFYGRPVIATKSGGPAEIIDHNETGILVELRNIKQMAAAMEYLIMHPAERAVMGKKAYQSVRERFSYPNTIGRLKDVYESALLR